MTDIPTDEQINFAYKAYEELHELAKRNLVPCSQNHRNEFTGQVPV